MRRKRKGLCVFCGGVPREGKVILDRWRGEALTVFTDVPVEVCLSCGEKYLSADTIEAIEEVLRKRPKPARTLEVPVYSLS